MKLFKKKRKKEKKKSGLLSELILLKRTLFCILDNQVTMMMFMQAECKQYRRRDTEELSYHFNKRMRDSDGIKDDLRGVKNIQMQEFGFDFDGFAKAIKEVKDNGIEF